MWVYYIVHMINIVGERYWECSHKSVDLVKAVVDDLHWLFLGVSKLLISLWFSKTYRSFDFYIRFFA